jgi:hypothetical protein
MKQGTGNGEQGSEPNTPFQRKGVDGARQGGDGGEATGVGVAPMTKDKGCRPPPAWAESGGCHRRRSRPNDQRHWMPARAGMTMAGAHTRITQ